MMPYAVVKFPVDNTIGVICTKWLDQEGKICKYPTSKIEFLNMSKILKKECDPSADWDNHPVVILGRYETYAEAKRLEQKAEDTSNLSNDEEDFTRKRKRRPNSKYEEINDDRSPSPPPKKSKNGPPKHPSLTSFSSPSETTHSKPLSQFQSPQSNNIQTASNSLHHSPYPDHDYNHQVPPSHQQQPTHHSLCDDDFTQQTPPRNPRQPTHHSLYSDHDFTQQPHTSHQYQLTHQSPYSDSDFSSSHQQQPTYQTLYSVNDFNQQTPTTHQQQPIIQQKRLQKPESEDIIAKINHLSSMMAAYHSRMDDLEKKIDMIIDSRMNKENRAEEDNIFNSLPITTMDGFDEYEQKLRDDEGFRKAFVKAMSALGGRDPGSLVINIMKCLLTDKVAELFSLTGKRIGNVPAKRKFMDTKMSISIFDAVRRRHKDVSNDVTKNAMKHWLQQATPRIQKRERRQVLAEEGGGNGAI